MHPIPKRWWSSIWSASAAATQSSARSLLHGAGGEVELIGQTTETEFDCPLSQFVIADALGLTSIHVNRVLRQLRDRGLLTVRKKTVKIEDLAGLRKLAGFRVGYLNSSR
jgi:CRP-like cAMP-binding protein